MTTQFLSNLSVSANAIPEFIALGAAGACMTVTISTLELCPVLPEKFRRFRSWTLLCVYVAFVGCGGAMAVAVGLSGDPPHKPLFLIAAGAGWHSVLLVWSKLAMAVKSAVEAWKNSGAPPD